MTPAELDLVAAERNLKEVKQVLDEAGITFFLREGTLLGAIRDGGLIPWDDDVDICSIFGLHVFSEDEVERIARTVRSRGFLVRIGRNSQYTVVAMVRDTAPISWSCNHVVDDAVLMFPAVRLPMRLFTDLKRTDFLGEEFLVPHPPEEYLAAKYGKDWRVPKRAGEYERDVLAMIPDAPVPRWLDRLRRSLAGLVRGRSQARVQVFDEAGEAVVGATISVAAVGTFPANRQGVIRLHVPISDYYALTIKSKSREYVIYVQRINLGEEYTYRLGDQHLRPSGDTRWLGA
jgi:hypothetical protein